MQMSTFYNSIHKTFLLLGQRCGKKESNYEINWKIFKCERLNRTELDLFLSFAVKHR